MYSNEKLNPDVTILIQVKFYQIKNKTQVILSFVTFVS